LQAAFGWLISLHVISLLFRVTGNGLELLSVSANGGILTGLSARFGMTRLILHKRTK
jgi:hypothetical protein